MGTQKGIYVRDADADLWARAESYARARRVTMSALIMNALEAYLDEHEDVPDTLPSGFPVVVVVRKGAALNSVQIGELIAASAAVS